MDALLKLGIDWQSIIFYVVNFGILFAIIGKFLVPPIIKMLDKRSETIAHNIHEANKLKNEFQEKMEQMNKEKEEAHLAMMKEMDNLNKTLEKKKAELNEQMQLQKTKLLEDAQKEIDLRKAQLMEEAEAQTLELIKKVVVHIVQNKLPEDLVKQSVKEAWEVYRK